jgi:hypothetical protein
MTTEIPGPGNYEQKGQINNKGGLSFGKELRPQISTLSPGPGAYDG